MKKNKLWYLFRPDHLINSLFQYFSGKKTVYLRAANGNPLICFDKNGNMEQTPAQRERYFNCAMFDFDQSAGKTFLFEVLEGKKDHIVTAKGKLSFLYKAKKILEQGGFVKHNNNLTQKTIVPLSEPERERLIILIREMENI